MARQKKRSKAKLKTRGGHSPSRRKALQSIAAYIGDKALGGVIGGTALTAATALVARLTVPAPSGTKPVTSGSAPFLISVRPARARPGDVITIWGENFGAEQGESFVTIGCVKATIV